MTAFYVSGLSLAAWAVILAFVGLKRPDFPNGARGGRVVMTISIVLVALAIGSGIVSGALEAGAEEGEAAAARPA